MVARPDLTQMLERRWPAPHPLDFSPEGRKSLQVIDFVGEVHGDHVRFVLVAASEVAKRE